MSFANFVFFIFDLEGDLKGELIRAFVEGKNNLHLSGLYIIPLINTFLLYHLLVLTNLLQKGKPLNVLQKYLITLNRQMLRREWHQHAVIVVISLRSRRVWWPRAQNFLLISNYLPSLQQRPTPVFHALQGHYKWNIISLTLVQSL